MYLAPDVALQAKLQRWSRALIVTVFVIALLVLIGWQFDILVLRRPFPRMGAMNPLTAVCFLCLTLSFLLLTGSQKTKQKTGIGILLTSLVLLAGLLKTSEIIFGLNIQPDQLLFPSRLKEFADARPNVMALNTAISFLLSALSLLYMVRYEIRKKKLVTQYIALAIGLLSWLSILSYLYNTNPLGGILIYMPMAIHTAFCFFIFSLAMLFAQPGKGLMCQLTSVYSGSVIARILIPAAVVIPSVLGLLRLEGFRVGIYNNELGTALFAISIITIFAAITWYYAYLLNKRDALKIKTETALRASDEQVRAIFENAPDAVIMIDNDGKIVKWNPEAEKLFGWKASEVAGKLLTDSIIPPTFREAHKNGMHRLIHTGESTILGKTIEIWALKKDGQQIDVSLRVSPMNIEGRQYFVGFMRDITEKKLMENKLRSFNDELAQQVEYKTRELTDIFERITDGFIALDKDFNYTYMNKKAGEIMHRDPASLIGKNVWDEFPAAVGSSTYEAFTRAMREQQYVSNTDYYEPFDLWQENHIYPSPNGLSIFIRDISERKKAEKEITEARTLADKLIDSLPGVFYFFDANGKFIRWNKEFEEVTGYSSAEIAEMHPTDFFEGEEKQYIARRIEEVFLKGVNDAEASFVTKNGQRILYYFKAVLMQYQGAPCLLGSGINIEKRKKAEDELKVSEQKYKLLFESNPLPMWMLSLPEYQFIDVNNAALLQYGYTREQFLQLNVLDIRPKEEADRFHASSSRSFRGVHRAGIWRHKKKDGTIIYVDVITHDFLYKDQPTRLVLANDVTEKYIWEEKLKESYDSIRQLTDHLQKIREEERTHIAREIHDELGQLLTVMKMDISWLKKKVDPAPEPIKEKFVELLGVVDTTVKTIRRIASELRPTLLDDLGLVAAMEWHLEEFEKRSGIQKEFEGPGSEIHIADSVKIGLFRILQESLTNVARHSGAKKVNVSLEQNGRKIVLKIADNGKGYDMEKASKHTLGVLGMKERTAMMGGEYHITGFPGKGTSIEVIVPIPNEPTNN
jgi:PAS domain S-box-containing protein